MYSINLRASMEFAHRSSICIHTCPLLMKTPCISFIYTMEQPFPMTRPLCHQIQVQLYPDPTRDTYTTDRQLRHAHHIWVGGVRASATILAFALFQGRHECPYAETLGICGSDQHRRLPMGCFGHALFWGNICERLA